ncbi:PREDICTED: uncharacterized protein LOC106104274 [Papilio polytes]|uniref:uncharacterized protein LOC106104274 n=1 Tax=Papilio polytes TaxID=76194 RepID=UPI0006766A97|nr:PREDICTED: uncharacterized protein LOC106104274 [Papilio polytes]
MGQGCSCNETWCSLMSKLQSSAEERKSNRSDSNNRPKCLRLRRRIHKGKCNCKTKCEQETLINIGTHCGKSMQESRKKPCQVHFWKASGEPPTKCCSQKSPQNLTSKNICRFTVDAYFN